MQDLDLREEVTLSKSQIREGAPYAALSYVFFLCILTFIFKKDTNEFAHFHARQGIVIFVGELICFFLLAIPLIGQFFCRIGLIILFVASLCGIFSALTGKMSRISLVSDLAQKMVI
ncbi:MAG: hypothetical protein JSV34_05145 [Candidatus Omnitrophota bacterium]|nr:MAG: hypothetical protein JSV34_05145 [Candidatus Omnitrophota bacterium]